MPAVHPARLAAPAALLLVALAAASCSKDSKSPTSSTPNTTRELDGSLAAGSGLYSHRFFAAGNFAYHCTIHPGMSGTVVVSAGAPAADSIGSVLVSGFTFTPASVTIPVGGVVTWTNSDPAPHTVTSN